MKKRMMGFRFAMTARGVTLTLVGHMHGRKPIETKFQRADVVPAILDGQGEKFRTGIYLVSLRATRAGRRRFRLGRR